MKKTIWAALVAVSLTFAALVAPAHADQWDQDRLDTLIKLNELRTTPNPGGTTAGPVKMAVALNEVAQECADALAAEMKSVGDLRHCDGTNTPGQISLSLASYQDRIPAGSTKSDENVAAGQAGLLEALAGWDQAASGPKDRIHDPEITHVGFGIAKLADGSPVYVMNLATYASDSLVGDVITETPTPTPTPTPVPSPTPTPTPTLMPTPTPTPPSPTATPTTTAPTTAPTTTAPGAPATEGTGEEKVDVTISGDEIIVSLSGFEPNTSVQVWLHSDPILLGVVKVNDKGRGTFKFPIPDKAEPGKHTIQIKWGDNKPLSIKSDEIVIKRLNPRFSTSPSHSPNGPVPPSSGFTD